MTYLQSVLLTKRTSEPARYWTWGCCTFTQLPSDHILPR